jgi:hypothetical protein
MCHPASLVLDIKEHYLIHSVYGYKIYSKLKSILIKHHIIAQISNQCLELGFLIKLLHIVYLIIMAVPRYALTSIVFSSYIKKMYYFS